MQCRKCHAEIADKALICYRCGTATTDAKYQPAPVRGRRSSSRSLVIAIIIAVLLLLALYFSGTLSTVRPVSEGSPRRLDNLARVLTTKDTKDATDHEEILSRVKRSSLGVLRVPGGDYTFELSRGGSVWLRLDGVS
jgi:hypothetical protein